MKKSLINHKEKKEKPSPILKLNRERVLRAFRDLGYAEDYKSPYVTVLRNLDFPFQRVTIPNHSVLSSELIKLYAHDLRLDFQKLMQKILM
ncbi:MAG: hypothetical protein D6748_12900 [Calditrichaeota bacterium]|nr:MAG: hypothetical protein D6748_12900 [Calditrichota bacterium]